ncbi:hypothetical protein [Sporosarcina sp. FA9]|uniref:hypothetical protein n=1 Tax=Sporosarcina sp. FA9 TaxID=3413030 RepID=UPI003F65FF2D
MKIVQVKDIPVRYESITYQPGSSFEMEEKYVNESLVIVTGDVEVIQKTIEEMTIAELKDYAASHEIDLGDAKKRDEILEAIQIHELQEDNQKQEGDE